VRLSHVILLASAALLAGCDGLATSGSGRPESAQNFPVPDRPVVAVVSNEFSTEDDRDERGEAQVVMDLADIRPGMTVADIGAGEGYYTVRLAERVGEDGRVLAQDISREALDRLGRRVERERLENISIKFGDADNPQLPPDSFDRIFMVHMYHEVTEPYAFTWRMRDALKPRGQIIVVDRNRPTSQHGMPPKLLFCEFAAVGYRLMEFEERPEVGAYFARFERDSAAPTPAEINTCKETAARV
jgi:ubiquinone/menaquinone biosynthesis C-methylase UbiE